MALEVGVHAHKGLGKNVPRVVAESLQQITRDSLGSKSVLGALGVRGKSGFIAGTPKLSTLFYVGAFSIFRGGAFPLNFSPYSFWNMERSSGHILGGLLKTKFWGEITPGSAQKLSLVGWEIIWDARV